MTTLDDDLTTASAVDGDTTAAPTGRGRRLALLIGGGTIAAGALAFGGIALTNAWFTSQAEVDGQSVSTATVEIAAGLAPDTDPIAVTDLLPGDEAITVLDVKNTGTEDVYFAVGPFDVAGDSALADALAVTVVVNGADSTTHTLTEWSEGQYEGIALAAGATTQVSVLVELSVDAENTLQDTDAAFSVGFEAIQARNFTGTTTPTWVSAE